MGLRSHISDAYDAFSSYCVSSSLLLSLMNISLTNLTMKVLGPGSHPFMLLFIFSETSVGPVSSSKPVGRVSSSESIGCVSISNSVGNVSGIFSVDSVS